MARDNAFLDHHHIIYRLTVSNDILIWQVDSGLDVGYEIANELISSLIERLVEKVEKVGYKFSEKSLNKVPELKTYNKKDWMWIWVLNGEM